ncbi:MAG: hypothetical protein AB7U82_01645 [Blastocatellales bacterium]
MQNPIIRLKNTTRLFLLFIFAASLLMTWVWLSPNASASQREGKGKKSEGKDTNKAPEWLTRARRLRRQMHGFDSPEGKSAGKRSNAANDFAEHRVDDSEASGNLFDFSPDRIFNYIFGQTYDKPREAAQYFVQKRLPEGERSLPIEKYFEAQERMRGMRYFSTALDRVVTGGENFTAPLNEADKSSATPNATWTPLGPGNIGGRTRSILINPQTPSVMYAAGVSGGVWKTTNGGQSWAPIADLIGNITVSSMAMEPGNPNVIYIGTGEGIYGFERDTSVGDFRGAGIFKTTDAGANWTRLDSTKTQDFFYVNDLAISPNDKNRIYAATKTGVWRTTDGGAAWTRVLEPKNEDGGAVAGGCLDLAVRTDKQTDFIFASCGTFEPATIYRNTDASGTGTWEGVLTDPNMGRTSLAIAPSNQEIVYALASSIEFGPYELGLHAVYRSTSGGAANSWTTQVSNTDQNKLNTLLLTNPLIATLTDCQFDLSEDFFNQGWYDNTIAVDPLDPDRVWAGGIDLFRSDDGGKNWGVASYWWLESPGTVASSPYAHADQHTIVFHPQFNGASNQTMFVGGDGGVFRTDNARAAVATGKTATCKGENSAVRWTAINNNYGVTQFYFGSVSPDGKTYIGGTQDNGTLLGTDGGGVNAWKEINGGDGAYTAVDFNNPNTLYASFPDISFVKSTDGGVTFGDATAGINDGGLFITPFAMDPSDPRRLWTGGDFIWRTDNGAARWFRASTITAGVSQVSAIAIAPTDSNRMLVAMADGYIHRNNNALAATGTTSWPSTRPRSGWVSSLAIDPGNKDITYATYSTFGGTHVWRSVDGGATWSPLNGSGAGALPDVPVHSIAIDPSNTARLYIGTDVGVFVSTDGGANWAVETTGFPNVITESLQIQIANGVTQVYAFTHGRGVWRAVINNSGCDYGLSPATVNAGAGAASGTINVTAQPGGCTWISTSNATWLKVNGGGSANGVVSYTVDENTAFAARVATATIAGRTFTVFQSGRDDIESPEIAITEPQVTPAVVNTSGLITIGGTTRDNNAVVGVTWATDRGAAGVATLTGGTQWRATNIPLSAGMNLITVTARDAAGNLGRATMNVASMPQAVLTTVVGTGQRGTTGDGGPAASALISRPIRLDFDSAGNLYLTDSDNHTIRKVTPQGVISTIAGVPGQFGFSGDNGPATSALLNFPIGVAIDGAGNVYICDNDNNRIRKVTAADGNITTIAGNGAGGFGGDGGPATAAQFIEPQNVAVDKDGNIYISDFGNHRIRKVTASNGNISTVAGNGAQGFSGDGGPATDAQLNSPNNVSVDKDGNLIICDPGNFRIRKVTAADGKISTVAGKGAQGSRGDGGPATDAEVNVPVGAIVDQAGNLYFSDRNNQRVRKVAAATGVITTVAGSGAAGFNGDGLAALASSLGFPTGLAIDSAGNLYIGDRDNGRVRKLVAAVMSDSTPPTIAITSPTSSGVFTATSGALNLSGASADNAGVFNVRWSNDRGGSGVAAGTSSWSVSNITLLGGLNNITVTAWDANGNSGQASLAVTFNAQRIITGFAGAGGPGDSGDGGAAVVARMSPFGLAVDASGALLVSDDEAHRVRRITPGGSINAFAGNGALGASGDGAAAINAAMNFPQDVVVDAAGNAYISDSNNHRVRRVAPDGVITTYAGTGVPDFGGDGGPAAQAKLISPSGLALDSAGNLYIADSGNARVRKVTTSTGVITTVAGNGLIGFSGDNGQATQATFKQPFGVAVDKNGVVYILDRIDSRIRRVATDGVITTIAGTGQPGYNGDDRPASGARINGGGLMTTDSDGNLYFADFLNHRVRKITVSTGVITTIVGNGTPGTFGDGGEPGSSQIFLPTDVAIDGGGNIYVADWGNYRIRKIQSTGGFRTVSSVSAASFLGDALASESIAAAFGQNLATSTQSANSLPLPNSLGGTTVRVRDASGVERLAPLFAVMPTQVNFEIPPSTANGAATITITSGDGSISTGVVQIASVAPGLFSANADGQGVAAAVVFRIKANGQQTFEPVARLDQATNKFVTEPIDLGPDLGNATDQVFLVLFGTGARFRSSLMTSSTTIGGANAETLYVGPTGGFIGLDQSNIRLGRNLIGRGEVEVKLTVDGKTSNTVRINIK